MRGGRLRITIARIAWPGKRAMLRTFACMLCVAYAPLAGAADGDVDLSFGGGQVTITRPPGFPTAPTPTGDVLGLADDGADGAFAWTGACLVHVEPDGSLEAGFGGVPIVDADYYVVDFARDASGRFVFAATTGQTWDVLRYEADGVTPDATFGGDGHVRIDVGATNNLRGVNALAVRDDGRIVTAGWRGNEHGPNLVVAQLTETGELDPAWNAARSSISTRR
jgi:hypothetical protein